MLPQFCLWLGVNCTIKESYPLVKGKSSWCNGMGGSVLVPYVLPL